MDDCEDTRELYAEYLELSGYDVKEAGDGISALREAAQVLPDVVIMDMSLPGLDGREAARRLRADQRTRAIPLVVLSGFSPEMIARGEGEVPWNVYLGKPCMPDDLVKTISGLIAGRG